MIQLTRRRLKFSSFLFFFFLLFSLSLSLSLSFSFSSLFLVRFFFFDLVVYHGALAKGLADGGLNQRVGLRVAARRRWASADEGADDAATNMLAVASSSTMMRDRRSRARARHTSCRSPTEKFSPFSITGASSPLGSCEQSRNI